ncbi:right-handed parallel beta-helix repeat-containing protein [Hymenobacter cellulosivorans]|uniref:Right-handed parallel beta-helix repeat-containing protein n=1 Tax=Hymenobacter cellulosivorans TaxID=2932249 RepID=A0ABY4F5C1_9BACT|nr:right-handed parallel beta-helix repeat-containing protein [Hymenobacter cellulosivorans]UOQ51119.1 right-handed parallel beta-helix repeat-containing protein [Hymenobacter cellulosivorans]
MIRSIPASLLLLLSALTMPARAADIWVAPNGSDRNPGTAAQPLATLTMALRQARDLRRLRDASVQNGVHIWVKGGEYRLAEPWLFRPEDAGTASSPTIIEAAPGEQPVLSGGMSVTGWKKAAAAVPGLPKVAQGQLWVADAPLLAGRTFDFRQLWVNGRKAIRARTPNNDQLPRLLRWDTNKREAWIPAAALGGVKQPGQLEMVLHQMWAVNVLRVKSVVAQGKEARVTFHEPESRIQFEHPWPRPIIDGKNGSSAFYLTNAVELLDKPGEWFYDAARGQLLYWPRPGENLSTAQVIVPALETLVRVSGSLDQPVSYVQFRGLTFAYTTWLRPSEQGHVPLQAGLFMLDAYSLKTPGTPDKKDLENQAWLGRPSAAVELSGAHHTSFTRCRFEHLASAGLDYRSGTHDDAVTGCTFRDIAGNGLQMGKFSDEGTETHLPYNPIDPREICTNEVVENNLLTDCGNEDWGCVGIAAGYVRQTTIRHNEISQVPYTGISLGWGWTKTANAMHDNRLTGNYIHHYAQHTYDVAGIYTLSAQPGTVISENRVEEIGHAPYVHDPDHWFYLYLDEGSSGITVQDNWCPAEKFLANANGPNNVWKNNGPMVSDAIKQAAGLEPAYHDLRATAGK